MSQELIKEVETFSKSKPVVIYMKGSPEFPSCGFSARACQILTAAGVAREDLGHFDVLENPPMRTALQEYTNWPTTPQIFFQGEFVGGGDILAEMFESGDLQKKVEVLKS